jgi:hypothetical protein
MKFWPVIFAPLTLTDRLAGVNAYPPASEGVTV